jgi:hypothetical protein
MHILTLLSDYVRLSTTVATNALLERTGQAHALLITAGFRDLLLIGNQSRPKIFDLNIRRPPPLYDSDSVVEVEERVTLEGFTSDPKWEEREVRWGEEGEVERAYGEGVYGRMGGRVVRGDSGEGVRILKEPGKFAFCFSSYRSILTNSALCRRRSRQILPPHTPRKRFYLPRHRLRPFVHLPSSRAVGQEVGAGGRVRAYQLQRGDYEDDQGELLTESFSFYAIACSLAFSGGVRPFHEVYQRPQTRT